MECHAEVCSNAVLPYVPDILAVTVSEAHLEQPAKAGNVSPISFQARGGMEASTTYEPENESNPVARTTASRSNCLSPKMIPVSLKVFIGVSVRLTTSTLSRSNIS